MPKSFLETFNDATLSMMRAQHAKLSAQFFESTKGSNDDGVKVCALLVRCGLWRDDDPNEWIVSHPLDIFKSSSPDDPGSLEMADTKAPNP